MLLFLMDLNNDLNLLCAPDNEPKNVKTSWITIDTISKFYRIRFNTADFIGKKNWKAEIFLKFSPKF